MVIQLESLFKKFGLMHCVIAFVKYEGNNLIITTFALCLIIDREPAYQGFKGICFKDVMSKAC